MIIIEKKRISIKFLTLNFLWILKIFKMYIYVKKKREKCQRLHLSYNLDNNSQYLVAILEILLSFKFTSKIFPRHSKYYVQICTHTHTHTYIYIYIYICIYICA